MRALPTLRFLVMVERPPTHPGIHRGIILVNITGMVIVGESLTEIDPIMSTFLGVCPCWWRGRQTMTEYDRPMATFCYFLWLFLLKFNNNPSSIATPEEMHNCVKCEANFMIKRFYWVFLVSRRHNPNIDLIQVIIQPGGRGQTFFNRALSTKSCS